MSMTPRMVPTMLPLPPKMLVPPSTTAAITSSSMPVPMSERVVVVPEAAAAGLPVTVFAPGSPVAADIRAVAAEVIRRDPSERPGEPEHASVTGSQVPASGRRA